MFQIIIMKYPYIFSLKQHWHKLRVLLHFCKPIRAEIFVQVAFPQSI